VSCKYVKAVPECISVCQKRLRIDQCVPRSVYALLHAVEHIVRCVRLSKQTSGLDDGMSRELVRDVWCASTYVYSMEIKLSEILDYGYFIAYMLRANFDTFRR